MAGKNHKILESYISQLQISPILGGFVRVPPSWVCKNELPEYNRFYYVTGGEGRISIDGKEYAPKPGQLYLLPAGRKIGFSLINENRLQKYFCHFTANVGINSLFDIVQVPHYVEIRDSEQLINLFNRLFECFENRNVTSLLLMKSVLLEMIALYINESPADLIGLLENKTTDKLNEVFLYINRHIQDEISLQNLSEQIHFHPNYFIRFFKRHTGTSPQRYIANLRLQKAKLLLETSDISIKEIATMVGYKDSNHFTQAFKQYSGFTPSEHRKAEA